MTKDLDALLDKCIDRMNEGESLEECLTSYPEYATELEPLLRAVWDFRDACSPIPRPTAKSVARRRLDAILANSDRGLQKLQRRPVPLFGWSRAWATVAIALVLALVGFGLNWMLTPQEAPIVAQANFRLLLSDEENAIGDFRSLKVTITSIGVLRGGEGGGWEVIELEPKVVDLTHLPGLNAQEIWSGRLPEGQYTQVFIYIEDAIGTLRNGETVNVIIPSGSLQIDKPFEITAGDPIVNFVYDVTVVAAGNEYVLLPQVDQSGPHQSHHEVGEGELTLQIVAPDSPYDPVDVSPGVSVRVLVKFENSPVVGATVTVEDVGEFTTDADGRTESFTVPFNDELEIKAKKGELEGELEIEFGDELTLEVIDPVSPYDPVPLGEVTQGMSVRVLVTLEGSPVVGALVTVEDVGEFTTDTDGLTLAFDVPDADELEIKAKKGELEGELEIDLEQD